MAELNPSTPNANTEHSLDDSTSFLQEKRRWPSIWKGPALALHIINLILQQNAQWSENQPATHFRFNNVTFLHSTVDNNDVQQDTRDGKNTTHDTNRTLFYPILPDEDAALYKRPLEELDTCPREPVVSVGPYCCTAQKDPAPIEGFTDIIITSKVDRAFRVNVLWSILDALPSTSSDEMQNESIGSWTPFQKRIHTKQANMSN